MEFSGCTRPLRILGNGAIIRCAAGLRYGTFNPRTGDDFVLGLKEITLPDGVPRAVWGCLSGEYGRGLDGVC